MNGDDDRERVDLGIETIEEYQDKRAELVTELEKTIGDASASDVSACVVVNIGTKACGGPVEYGVYSSTDGDTGRILELAEKITDLDAEANEKFGLASTCDVPIPPTPVLMAGKCVPEGFRINAP